MKTNHDKVISSIILAIQQCSEDASLEGARRLLKEALTIVQKVGKKRTSSYKTMAMYEEIAKKNRETWMNKVKEYIKRSMESKENQDDERTDG